MKVVIHEITWEILAGRAEGSSGGHGASVASHEAGLARRRAPGVFSRGVCPPAFCRSRNILLSEFVWGC